MCAAIGLVPDVDETWRSQVSPRAEGNYPPAVWEGDESWILRKREGTGGRGIACGDSAALQGRISLVDAGRVRKRTPTSSFSLVFHLRMTGSRGRHVRTRKPFAGRDDRPDYMRPSCSVSPSSNFDRQATRTRDELSAARTVSRASSGAGSRGRHSLTRRQNGGLPSKVFFFALVPSSPFNRRL